MQLIPLLTESCKKNSNDASDSEEERNQSARDCHQANHDGKLRIVESVDDEDDSKEGLNLTPKTPTSIPKCKCLNIGS